MVEVSHSGCIVSFHLCHKNLFEFPFSVSGSAKAQVLRGEVDKVLQKDTLKLVDHPGSGYCSWLSLVIYMTDLNGYVTFTKFKMETVSVVLLSIRKGGFMLPIHLKNGYFQIFIQTLDLIFRSQMTPLLFNLIKKMFYYSLR